MGWTVNYFLLRRILEDILEGIGDIYNNIVEVVCVRNGNNNPECR